MERRRSDAGSGGLRTRLSWPISTTTLSGLPVAMMGLFRLVEPEETSLLAPTRGQGERPPQLFPCQINRLPAGDDGIDDIGREERQRQGQAHIRSRQPFRWRNFLKSYGRFWVMADQAAAL